MDSTFWNDVYQKKTEREFSWFQEVPVRSLELINELPLNSEDPIIDIGGGDSHLADELLHRGFKDVSILDISSVALDRAKVRLGTHSQNVQFVASDVTKFKPSRQYRLWHDRAALHFLTNTADVKTYLEIANQAIVPGGFLIVSTFSRSGPEKCSGLPISQYAEDDLKKLFQRYFDHIRCFEHTHTTPWGTGQNFVYCGFVKR